MSTYPISDVGAGWGYHPGTQAASTVGAGLPSYQVNSGLQVPFPGYSYMGASALTHPRRHFPNATPVLGNYTGTTNENEGINSTLDPYVSKFSPTTQWQMTAVKPTPDSIPFNETDVETDRHMFEGSVEKQPFMELPDPQLQVQLCDRELWDQFSRAGTEMIVTKTGRRMFPGYRIKLSGLDQNAKYCVMMDIVNVDDHRYKFQHGDWVVAGRGEPHLPQRFFLHPNSPATGSKWMSEIVSFHKVKLTNSVGRDVDGKIVLNSMHRYQPRIHVVRTDDVTRVHMQRFCTFAFPQTVFITVTAYQNPEVTKLKIDNNPFAKGFREDGARAKKPRNTPNQCSDSDISPYADKRPFYGAEYRHDQFYRPQNPGMQYGQIPGGFHNGASPELQRSRVVVGRDIENQGRPHGNFMINQTTGNNSMPINSNPISCWRPMSDMENSNGFHHTFPTSNHIPQLNPLGPQTNSLPISELVQCNNNNFIPYQPSHETFLPSDNVSSIPSMASQLPHNFDDVITKTRHEDITLAAFQNATSGEPLGRSSDSGIGSSPSTPSDEENTDAVADDIIKNEISLQEFPQDHPGIHHDLPELNNLVTTSVESNNEENQESQIQETSVDHDQNQSVGPQDSSRYENYSGGFTVENPTNFPNSSAYTFTPLTYNPTENSGHSITWDSGLLNLQ